MAEYKNGVSALGNVSVTKEDAASEVQTGRVVFVDEDKYANDAAYKAKVDKCVAEGFMRSDEAGSGGGGGILEINTDHYDEETGINYYDKTWQEVYDALSQGKMAVNIGTESGSAYCHIVSLVTYGSHYSVEFIDGMLLYADSADGYLNTGSEG